MNFEHVEPNQVLVADFSKDHPGGEASEATTEQLEAIDAAREEVYVGCR